MAEQPKVTPRGDVIRRLRAEQGFETLEAFAAHVGIDVRLVRAAEKGEPSTPKTIHAIANALEGVIYDDLIKKGVDIGFRKEGDATPEDIKQLVQLILAQEGVEYAVFVRKRPFNSVLIEINLEMDTIQIVLTSFANGAFDHLDITAIHLPLAFQEYVHALPPELYGYSDKSQGFKDVMPISDYINMINYSFESWLARLHLTSIALSFAADGSAIIAHGVRVEEGTPL